MKKILSISLATLLCLSFFCLSVFAASPTITADNITCKKTEVITLSFNVTKNSGIASAGFDLTYDSNMFTYESHGYGGAFEGGMTVGNNVGDETSSGTGIFKYAFIKADGTNLGGEMFNVSFKVSDKVEAGKKYEFTLVCTDSTDKDLVPIKLNNVTVTATVEGGLPSSKANSATSRIVGETSATIAAEEQLSNPDKNKTNNNEMSRANKNPNGGGVSGNDLMFVIIIAIVVLIAVAVIVVVILMFLKKKRNTAEEDNVFTNILSDDADVESLNLDDDMLDESDSDNE